MGGITWEHMALGTSRRERGCDAEPCGEPCAMAEDELDSFDTAWNKYMGEQAPMIQPFPDPAADGHLLNHEESIAFSRFFDNMLAQPASPRQTARRLDEELQRLSYATQPYAGSDYTPSENVHAPQYAAPDALGAPPYAVDRAFVASQPVYGGVPFDGASSGAGPGAADKDEDQKPAAGMRAALRAPTARHQPAPPFAAEPYGAKLDAAAGHAHYNYALGAMTPQEAYVADPRLDPRFYAATKDARGGTAPLATPITAPLAVPAEGKRGHEDTPADAAPPAEKRARTQRGELQTKLNHMNSEKRRRAHIRDLFDRMCSLVPRVARAAETLPKSHVLQETHSRLLELEAQNARLRGELAARGIDTASVPAIVLDRPV